MGISKSVNGKCSMKISQLVLLLFLLVLPLKVLADEDTTFTTFSCKTLRHVQILRTVVTEFEQFQFEVILKEETVMLTDRFQYGSTNLEYIKKTSQDSWTASDTVNILQKIGAYIYISRLDGVGVKSISAFCVLKKFE